MTIDDLKPSIRDVTIVPRFESAEFVNGKGIGAHLDGDRPAAIGSEHRNGERSVALQDIGSRMSKPIVVPGRHDSQPRPDRFEERR